jgi:hypothetical protein
MKEDKVAQALGLLRQAVVLLQGEEGEESDEGEVESGDDEPGEAMSSGRAMLKKRLGSY